MKLYVDYDRFDEAYEICKKQEKYDNNIELECNKKECAFITKAINDYRKAREMIYEISDRTHQNKLKKEREEYYKAYPEEYKKQKKKQKILTESIKLSFEIIKTCSECNKNLMEVRQDIRMIDIMSENHKDFVKEVRKYLEQLKREAKK